MSFSVLLARSTTKSTTKRAGVGGTRTASHDVQGLFRPSEEQGVRTAPPLVLRAAGSKKANAFHLSGRYPDLGSLDLVCKSFVELVCFINSYRSFSGNNSKLGS
ncbi:hypothetical protein NN561_020306 [Cricetulus griseus]